MKKIFTLSAIAILICMLVQDSFAQILTADAGTDQVICSGFSVPIGGSPTATGGTAPYTYNWAPAGGLNSPTIPNPTASPFITTVYTTTVTDALSNTATDQVVISVNPPPFANASNDQAICFGSCATITATGGTTYTWCCGIGPSPSVIVCPATTTTYFVTVSDPNGCTASDNVTITVLQIPNVTALATPSSICSGDNSILTASGGVSYLWSTGTTTASTNVTPVTTTTYTVTITSASGCTAMASATVTVTGLINPSVSASPDSVCSGASSILTAQGGVQYQWSNGATTSSVTVNPSITTSYTVTVSNGCGNSATETVTVVVQSNPTAEAGSAVSICSGGSAQLQASGGVSYAWSPATNINATNISNPVVNPPVTTLYYVTTTSSCGSAVDSVLVSVSASGTLVANAGIDYSIYPGSCVWLGSNPGASGGTPPYSFVWSNAAAGQYVQVCPGTTSVYTVTVSDAGGCMATDKDSVYVYPSLNRISGIVFQDDNGDGIQNNGELPYGGVLVHKNPVNNYTYVSPNSMSGEYTFYTYPGNYTVSLSSVSPYFIITPSSYIVNIAAGQNDTLNNFAMRPMPNVKDLVIDNYLNGAARPGFNYSVSLVYKNNGTIPMNGTVGFKHDPLCSFVSSIPANTGISGDTILWTFTNLLVGESRNISVQQSVPAGTPLGTHIYMYSKILPVVGDTCPANNYDSLTVHVVGSYDPNDKSVSPDRPLLPAEIANADPLTYVIRFQNTGTYYAEKVFVRDTLSPDLDISNFEMIGASHKYSLNYFDPGILEWMFDSIMLPDSATNQAGSNGFISYRIRPKTSLTEIDTIKNTAYIYFDFNAPVITNTTSSFLDATIGIETEEISQVSDKIKSYPNPFRNTVTLELPADIEFPCSVCVFNELSEQVFTKEITSSISTINSGNWSKGFYYFKIVDKQGKPSGTGKLIKQ